MASRLGALSDRRAVRAPVVVETLGILLVACALAAAIALLNQPYFAAVNGLVDAKDEVVRGVLFSSWLLLIGLPFAIWRPRQFGLTAGSIREHWRLVAGALLGAAAITAAVLRLTGHIPYSDASLFIETVDVPVTEELVFRGVLLTGLLVVLRRLHPPRTAMVLAVVFDGVAFGLAHLANATALDPGFVASQATFAVLVGAGCASLMARTGSLYPAIALHAVVNAVVVLV